VLSKLLFSLLFLCVVISDQVTKFIIDSTLSLHESRSIIGNVLQLTYVRNSGAAFGLSFGNQTVMFIVTVVVTITLFYLFISGKIDTGTIVGKIALVMVLGGAIGNLIDRIRMGEVIDFIDMGFGRYRWPVYNLADIYVTVGMFMLIFSFVIQSKSSEVSQ